MGFLRIHREILLETLFVFGLALLVVTGVLFTGQSLQTMSRWHELEFRYIWTLLPSLLPVAAAYGMPYAFLLAVALAFGRMASDREIVAMRISGVHPRAAVAPILALGAVLSVVSLVLNGWVLPSAAQSIRQQERNLPDIFLAALSGSEDGIALRQCRLSYAGYIPAAVSGGNGEFREFELDLRDKDGNLTKKCIGESARLARQGDEILLSSPLMWLFREDQAGRSSKPTVGPRREPVGLASVEEFGISMLLSELLGSDPFERKAKDVDLPDLTYMVARGSLPKVPLVRSLVELHGRLAGSFAPFVFGLVAAAVGLQLSSRSRRLTGFLLAFLPVVLIHFPLAIAGKSLADGGRVPPWAGMWLADAVLLLGGGILLRRAYTR